MIEARRRERGWIRMTAFPLRLQEQQDHKSRAGDALKDGTILLRSVRRHMPPPFARSRATRQVRERAPLLKNNNPTMILRPGNAAGVAPCIRLYGGAWGASRLPSAALRRFAVLTRPARPLDLAITGASPHERRSTA